MLPGSLAIVAWWFTLAATGGEPSLAVAISLFGALMQHWGVDAAWGAAPLMRGLPAALREEGQETEDLVRTWGFIRVGALPER